MIKKICPGSVVCTFFLLFASHPVLGQEDRPAFWTKNYGGSSFERPVAIKPTPDGGRIMCGHTTSNDFDVSGLHGTATDIWVVKLSNTGTIEWQKTYVSDKSETPSHIILTSDGGYAISGHTNGSSGKTTGLIVKITSTGTLEWQKQFEANINGIEQIAETTDGGFVVTGQTFGTPSGELAGLTNHGMSDLFVAKVSSTGTFLWARIFGGTLEERGFVIRQLNDGNILVAARAVSNNGDVVGNHNDWDVGDFWVLKLSPTGNVIWKKCYGGVGDETPYNGFEKNNRYFLIGTTMNLFHTSSGDVNGVVDGYDMWFVTLDTAGNLLRQKCIGGTSSVDDARDIAPTLDNNFIIGGYTQSNDVYVSGNKGLTDVALIKVDSLGNKLWGKLFGSNYYDWAYSVCANSDSTYSLLGEVAAVNGDVKNVYGSSDIWIVNYTDTSLFQDLYVDVIGSTDVFVGNGFIGYTLQFGKNTDAISGDTVTLRFVKDSRLTFQASSLPGGTVTGDTVFWRIPKSGITKTTTATVNFGIDPAIGFTPDSIKVKAVIGPYETEFLQTNNVDSFVSRIRKQSEAITNFSVDIQSVPAVGTNQIVTYVMRHIFRSKLNNNTWAVQLVKDPKVDFVSANPAPTAINGDTISWHHSGTIWEIDSSFVVRLMVKDTAAVQTGGQVKSIARLRVNTIDLPSPEAADILVQTVQFNCIAPDMVNTTLPSSQGIQWQRLFGGSAMDYGTGITAVSDTSFVMIAGSLSNDGDAAGATDESNSYAVKYLTNGSLVWKKRIDLGGNETLTSVVTAENGSVIAVGSIDNVSPGNSDVLLVKLDSQGNITWQKTIGGSSIEHDNFLIRKFRDNQYVLLIRSGSKNGDMTHTIPGSGPWFWLFVIDTDGNIVWKKVLADASIYLTDLQVTPDFKFVLVGEKTVNSRTGGILSKVDSTGSVLFSQEYKNDDMELYIQSVIANPDSTFTFAGFVYSFAFAGANGACSGDHGDLDSWVAKTDKAGNIIWQKFYGGSSSDAVAHIASTHGGGYLLTGISRSYDGNASGSHDRNGYGSDGWLVNLDGEGKLVWQKMIGGDSHDDLVRAIQLPNHDFIVTGRSHSYNNGDVFGSKGDADAWLVKIGASNSIIGTVFNDVNGNHVKDNDEPYFTTGIVKASKGALVSSSDIQNGFYAISVDTGTYITQPVISSPYYNQYPTEGTSLFESYLQTDTINFAMVPNGAINDLRITLLPVTAARPGFKAQYHVKYENTGTTTIVNGSVKLVKDNRTVFESASVNPSLLEGDTITWNFNNFEPMQSAEFTADLRLAIPPALNNGDTLRHFVTINPLIGDTTSLNNQAEIKQVVTGSYDPNDKTETHGPGFEQQKLSNGEYLNYVIRFQNTGTDTAFRVLVRDTLSNKLDLNSFEMINASHAYTLSITDSNKLEWKFDPVILPDSNHNYAASNGYVAFRIKPKSNLVQGDTITNRAGIYFDFNLPVLTNLLETVIYPSSLIKPVISGLDAEYCRKPRIVIGRITNPQPSNTGIATIVKLDNTTLAVSVDGTFNFDISSLTAGSHIISVKFILGSTTMVTEWPFNVREASVLNLNLSANITNVISTSQPVIITGVNTTGGTNLRYSFAKDRSFTNLLQPEGSSNTVTFDPGILNPGVNWIYCRISANGQCYTEEANIDSIQLNVNITTGIVDVDATDKVIHIYPVPFNDYLLLKGFSLAKKYEVNLVNAQGSSIYTATVKNRDSYEFRTSGLPAGVYVVHLSKNGKNLGAVKVVKQ